MSKKENVSRKNMKFGMIVPLRRCGSNAIRLRLSMNPSLFCPYPLHLSDLDQSAYGNLEDDLNYFQMVVDIVRIQATSLVPWKDVPAFDPVDIFGSVRDRSPRSKHTIYLELLKRAGEQHQAQFVLDKSQDSVQDWREWIKLCPSIRFLDIIRDPRAQISSMNQSVIYDYETTLNTLRWIQSRKYVEEIIQEYPDQIMTVRFEDFIKDEEKTMKKICAFFEIPFYPAVIQDSTEATMMAGRSPLWESNRSSPDPNVLQKYKTFLSPAEIEHIECCTFTWMLKYGYAVETPARNLLLYSREDALKKSETKKRQVWDALLQTHPYDYILRKSRARLFSSH